MIAKRARKKLEKLASNFDERLADELRTKEDQLHAKSTNRNIATCRGFHTFVKNSLTLVASLDLLTKVYYLSRHYFANEGLFSVYRWLLYLRFIVIALLAAYNVSSDREHYLRLRTSLLTLKVIKDDGDA